MLTVAGFGLVMYDLVFEACATISSPASDPREPFAFPFAVTNNSHVFTLRNID
jgi:hypothetical protein